MIRFIYYYCINYCLGNSSTGKNVIFCLQRYNCNVEKLFSGHMNSIIIKSRITRSTDCPHTALANLLHELIIVKDGLLVLPDAS